MTKQSRIETTSGPRVLVRRVGIAGEYYETTPTKSAPNGEWWTLNPQWGLVPVPSNSPGLRAALKDYAGPPSSTTDNLGGPEGPSERTTQ